MSVASKHREVPVWNRHLSDYLHKGLDAETRHAYVEYIAARLRKHKLDTLVFSGMSGALVAPAVADRLGTDLGFVRKDVGVPAHKGGSHSMFEYEGPRYLGRWAIIDDFMSSGRTMRRIVEAVESRHLRPDDDGMAEKDKLVAVVEYNGSTATMNARYPSGWSLPGPTMDSPSRRFPGVKVYGGYAR